MRNVHEFAQLVEEMPLVAAPEPSVRPKVMRRPHHFSATPAEPAPKPVAAPTPVRSAPEPSASAEMLMPKTPALATPLQFRIAWQDDIRFGAVMIGLVVLLNLAMLAWLPHMPHAAVASASTEPASLSADSSTRNVRMYKRANDPLQMAAPVEAAPSVHVLGAAPHEPATTDTP